MKNNKEKLVPKENDLVGTKGTSIEELEKEICEILAFYKYTDDEVQAETTEDIARKIIKLKEKADNERFLRIVDENIEYFKKPETEMNKAMVYFLEELKKQIIRGRE